ncbi:FUSC family protein [Herbidospora cretacea]|uniref:FUSC family protein n=1 Tax=Herbidospora cretacea TaxID=28444 RepID=UPI000774DA02|nr:FUSC family protein [Herbidospora cretacea]
MSRSWRQRFARTARSELTYLRGNLDGLRVRHSEQRLQARQIAKATFAAVAAWFLASLLLPHETIWIAPATAVIMVHATVYQTLTNGLRRVVAVAAGVILAGSIGHLLGLTALSLVLVIPPALITARWRRMGRHGSDVATTSVLMLSFGAASQERYLLAYTVATAMGALCGAAVNSLLWPPLYRHRPGVAVRRLAEHAADLLAEVAQGLREGWDLSGLDDWHTQADRLEKRLAKAEAEVAVSAESRRYNLRRLVVPSGGDHRSQLSIMNGVRVHVAAIVHALAHLDHASQPGPDDLDEGFARDYADLLDLLSDALSARARHPGDPGRIRDLLARAQSQAVRIHEQWSAGIRSGRIDRPAGWAVTGSLLTDAQRIITLLDDPAGDEDEVTAPGTIAGSFAFGETAEGRSASTGPPAPWGETCR